MLRTLTEEIRKRHWLYLGLLVIWTLAALRVFADHTPRVPVLFNVTDSLPYKVALVDYRKHTFARGDFIIYAFRGAAIKPYPGLNGQPFFKQVRGVPGDIVTVDGRAVFINGEPVGLAKPYGPRQVPMAPIAPVTIPPGYLYVQGTSADSFDSRYALSGLVPTGQILAAVHPLF